MARSVYHCMKGGCIHTKNEITLTGGLHLKSRMGMVRSQVQVPRY